MASAKAKMLEGYLDELNQPKPKTTTTQQKPITSSGMPSVKAKTVEGYYDEMVNRPSQTTGVSNPNKSYQAPAPSTPSVSSTPPVILQGSTTPNQNNQQNNQGTGTLNTGITENPPASAEGNTSYGSNYAADSYIRDYINEMLEAQRAARIAALDKAYQQALASLAEQEARLPQRYYQAANQATAQADIARLNHAQYMAGQGIRGAAAALPEVYRNVALQGQIGSLEQQKQQALDALARDRAGLASAYESDKLAALADIDARGLEAFINQLNADRLFGLQEAGLTGLYQGRPTLAAQNQAFNQRVTEAGLTGMYNGQPTFDYQKWLADTEYKNRTLEENIRQFNKEYGLKLEELDIERARNEIDKKYKEGLLSQDAAKQAMAELELITEQMQSLQSYVDYINTNFGKDKTRIAAYLEELFKMGVNPTIIDQLADKYGIV